MRAFMVVSWMVVGAARAQCPLPEVELRSVAEGEGGYDSAYSREVATELYRGALAGKARAAAQPLTVGGAVARLRSDGPLVAYPVRSLATRLRQLDCAVWSGHAGTPEPLYQQIADEARAIVVELGGSPPEQTGEDGWQLPPSVPPPGSPQLNPRREARNLRITGGLLVGFGAASLAGSLILSIVAATYQPPPPCGGYFCFNFLGEGIHDLNIAAAVILGVAGAGSAISGAVFSIRGDRYERRLTPVASVGPGGGYAGLRLTF